jgi:hypothetical protein
MPVAKIHLLEGQYSEARLDKGGRDLHAPAVGGRPQHPLRDVRRLSGLPLQKAVVREKTLRISHSTRREFGA